MNDHLTQRAQRLIEEFEEGESVRHGISNVLLHLAVAWSELESWVPERRETVPVKTLEDLAIELIAPTLLGRALDGDPEASRQLLQQMGVIDANGQLTERYRPYQVTNPTSGND